MNQRLAAAEKDHDELIQQWARVEGQVVAEMQGPAVHDRRQRPPTAIPGARTTYAVLVRDRDRNFRPATVEAQVQDAAGHSLFKTTFETDGTAGRSRTSRASRRS